MPYSLARLTGRASGSRTLLFSKENEASRGCSSTEDESEDHVCCAIAAGNHIKLDVLYRIGRTFSESVDKYRKNPEAYLAPYSNFMRFDQKLTEIASKEYGYPSELDYHKLARQFDSAGINVPLPSSVKDAVLPAG